MRLAKPSKRRLQLVSSSAWNPDTARKFRPYALAIGDSVLLGLDNCRNPYGPKLYPAET